MAGLFGYVSRDHPSPQGWSWSKERIQENTVLRGLGLCTFLANDVQAPIGVTFHAPADPAYQFPDFYRRVRERGFILYPGKLTTVDTFRVGCIGAIGAETIRQAVAAIGETLAEMGVGALSPA